MKTYELLKTVKQVAEATDGVGVFSHRDIYETINNNDVKYPVLCMALQSMTVRENYKECTFQLYAAERLTNAEDNRQFATAQLMDIAEVYIHNLKQTDGIADVSYDRQYNVAAYQTMDKCVCIYATIDVIVESDYYVC